MRFVLQKIAAQANKALDTQPKTRSFNVVTEVDSSGNERQVFVPGGIHYNVKPGELKSKHTTFLGCLSQVEVKMVDSLVIV